MSQYQSDIDAIINLRKQYGNTWDAINPEYAARRMKAQNPF